MKALSLEKITIEDFPLPSVSNRLAEIRDELEDGLGLKLLRGFPTDQYSVEDLRLIFWGLGLHIGTAVSQSKRNDFIGDVRDIGTGLGGPRFRGYTSNGELTFHVDAADVTGLFCLQTAKQGGQSKIVSSLAIHNEILRTRPDLLEVLYQPFYWSMQGNELPGIPAYYRQPVFALHEGHFACRYTPTHIRSAELADHLPDLTPLQKEGLELMEEISERSEFHLTLMFESGDIQFLNNHTTMHKRTAFEDYSEMNKKRHLLRLWLSPPNSRPLSDGFKPFFRDVNAGAVRGGFPGEGDPQFSTIPLTANS
ncbi:MAG: TauD/TfdA family dioxygenase [SAR324 cluster bacterium]|nr:TauD/TfdA family dioxygenase [SAR324 cluster bacterium]